MAEVGSATHFHSLNVAPIWGPHLLRVTQVGMHIFYRFSRRGAVPGDFTSEVEFVNRDMADAAGSLPILQAASAILDAQSTLVEGGVGGPATKAVEPASAPAAKLTQSRPGEQAEAKSTGFSAA